ncbi:cytochrome P450 [Micromonospora olivasterospora]|uniref:Cytochrome P450 n=1 Tax=Micromonospora olivasterospora TaxID=1880 RepID=A0A562I800_MICOL|nr:cytochrome P450 [Micromonospora olivasterospora]TWH67131.1 hypothetical protein JD77_02100 [Micromonospora olivasterospora]
MLPVSCSYRPTAGREALLDNEALDNAGNFILDSGNGEAPSLITQSDPPEHTFLRGVLRPAFQRASMTDAAPWIRELVEDLLDTLPDGGPADLVGEVALPLTSAVIARLIGIPDGDRARASRLALEMAAHVAGDCWPSGPAGKRSWPTAFSWTGYARRACGTAPPSGG